MDHQWLPSSEPSLQPSSLLPMLPHGHWNNYLLLVLLQLERPKGGRGKPGDPRLKQI